MDVSMMSDKSIKARRLEIENTQDELRLEYISLGRELDKRNRGETPHIQEPSDIQAEIDRLQSLLADQQPEPVVIPVVIPVKLGVMQAIRQKLGNKEGVP